MARAASCRSLPQRALEARGRYRMGRGVWSIGSFLLSSYITCIDRRCPLSCEWEVVQYRIVIDGDVREGEPLTRANGPRRQRSAGVGLG